MRICIYGLSGSGKSTTARLLREHYESLGRSVSVLKLAEPLYALQSLVYERAGRPIERYEQDQILLESLASHLRRINEHSLIEDFLARLEQDDSDLVINDDLRDPIVDYAGLRSNDFYFLRIVCDEAVRRSRLRDRSDRTTVLVSATSDGLSCITPDHTIDNSAAGLDRLQLEIRRAAVSLR